MTPEPWSDTKLAVDRCWSLIETQFKKGSCITATTPLEEVLAQDFPTVKGLQRTPEHAVRLTEGVFVAERSLWWAADAQLSGEPAVAGVAHRLGSQFARSTTSQVVAELTKMTNPGVQSMDDVKRRLERAAQIAPLVVWSRVPVETPASASAYDIRLRVFRSEEWTSPFALVAFPRDEGMLAVQIQTPLSLHWRPGLALVYLEAVLRMDLHVSAQARDLILAFEAS